MASEQRPQSTESLAKPPDPSDELIPYQIIVPVYNEADNFRPLIAEVEEHLRQPFTLNVLYDFDEDSTVPVARELAEDRPWIRLLRNDLGRGVVHAIRKGFQAVETGPALVMMADLSDDLRAVGPMLALYRQGYQVVCASRYMKGGKQLGGPWLKGLMSRTAGLSLRYLAGFPTHDATNNFRLYDAALVNTLGIESVGGFELALELTAKAFRSGAKVAQVPATWRDRTAGESRFQLRKWLPHYLKWYRYALTGRRPR